MRRHECITLSSLPGGTMPGGGGSGALLEAHEHLDLGAERALVELDRLLAATVEEQIGLDLHDFPSRGTSVRRCVNATAPLSASWPSSAARRTLRAQALLLLPELGREAPRRNRRPRTPGGSRSRIPRPSDWGSASPTRSPRPANPPGSARSRRSARAPARTAPSTTVRCVAREADACAFRARVQPFAREQRAGFRELLVVPAHRGEKLLASASHRLRNSLVALTIIMKRTVRVSLLARFRGRSSGALRRSLPLHS